MIALFFYTFMWKLYTITNVIITSTYIYYSVQMSFAHACIEFCTNQNIIVHFATEWASVWDTSCDHKFSLVEPQRSQILGI